MSYTIGEPNGAELNPKSLIINAPSEYELGFNKDTHTFMVNPDIDLSDPDYVYYNSSTGMYYLEINGPQYLHSDSYMYKNGDIYIRSYYIWGGNVAFSPQPELYTYYGGTMGNEGQTYYRFKSGVRYYRQN